MSQKITTRDLVPLKQTPDEFVDEDYGLLCPSRDNVQPTSAVRVCVVVLGILHIVLAFASIALGIAATCTRTTGYFIGYGIWCGFLFLLTGIITLITLVEKCMKNGMVTTSLVFNVMAACAAAVQFALGIVAASNDQLGSNRRLTASSSVDINRYDIFHSKLFDWTLCVGSTSYDWSTWGAIDVLLIIVAGLEAFIAVFVGSLACRSICSGRLINPPVYENNGEPATILGSLNDGYSNGGYTGPAHTGVYVMR